MGTHAPDQVCQLSGAGIGIIDTAHHGIFKAHAAAGGILIAAHGLHQHFHGIGIVHRHHAAANFIVGCVQRHREGQLQLFLGQLVDLGHQTAGRKADIAHSDILLGGVDLRADLACFQIAHAARLGGRAEAAAHAAAHLRGHTHRVAVVVAHHDGLDAVAVRHAQQIFYRAVLCFLPALDLGRGNVEAFFQLCQQGLGLVGHGRKLGDQLLVHPVEDLLCPEARLAHRFQFSGQLCQRKGRDTAFLFHCVLLLFFTNKPPVSLQLFPVFLHGTQEKTVHAGTGGHRKRAVLPCRHPGGQRCGRLHHRKLRVAGQK